MSPGGVHHVAIRVSDLSRAEAFYVGVLGLVVRERLHDEAGKARSIWLDVDGGVFLALEQATAAGPTRVDAAPGFHCVAISISKDLRETWRSRLEDAGHAVERETSFTIYVRDPDGNLVGLSHHPDPA